MANGITPLKVLLLSPTPPPIGGIARWTTLVVEALAEDPRVTIHLVDTKLRTGRITNRSLPLRFVNGLRGGLSVWRRGLSVTRRESPDVAHLNTSGSLGLIRDIVTLAYLRAAGVPTILHLRFGRVPSIVESGGWEAALLRVAARLSTKIISLDAQTVSAIDTFGASGKTSCIPNFALPCEIGSHVDREPIVLFTGHVVESKGVMDLREAWLSLDDRGPWRLELAGPVEDAMRVRLSSLPAVEVLGPLNSSEVANRLARARIFVLPSHTEGFPNSLLEGMHAGCACIASSVGAIPEMLDDGAGIVIRPRDPGSLAAALDSLITHPEEVTRSGNRARHRAQEMYTPAAVIPRYLSLWRASVPARRPEGNNAN